MNKNNNEEETKYKYRILEYFEDLSTADKKIAIKRLPRALNTPSPTFTAWCYIKITESRSIPSEKLFQIANYLHKSVEEMFTEKPEEISYEQLKADFENSKKERFNLKID